MSQRGTAQFPGSTSDASQLKSGDGFHGLLPSGAACSAAPGQRLTWRMLPIDLKTSSRMPGGIGVSVPLITVNALPLSIERAAPPLASKTPVWPKSSNQPSRSGVYGRKSAVGGVWPLHAFALAGTAAPARARL